MISAPTAACIPNRTQLDGLHHACVQVAIQLGEVLGAGRYTDDGKEMIERLANAEHLFALAMDRAVPVGGKP